MQLRERDWINVSSIKHNVRELYLWIKNQYICKWLTWNHEQKQQRKGRSQSEWHLQCCLIIIIAGIKTLFRFNVLKKAVHSAVFIVIHKSKVLCVYTYRYMYCSLQLCPLHYSSVCEEEGHWVKNPLSVL